VEVAGLDHAVIIQFGSVASRAIGIPTCVKGGVT